MFAVTLGFTSDPEKAPVLLAGPDVPYQKQEEDMNAAAVADTAPSAKGGGAIVRAEIWNGTRKQTFGFQDPAVKEMLLQQQREAQARAEEAAEAHRQTQLANLRAEVERLEAPERKAAEEAAEEAERIRLEEEAIEAARIAEEEAAKKAEKEAEELKALEAEIAAEEAVKETPSEKSKPKGK